MSASRLPWLAAILTLLALVSTTADSSAGVSSTATPPIQDVRPEISVAGLPILRLAGGPPRSLDNVWLGYNEIFLEVNAGLTHIIPDGRVAPDLATWTVSKNRLVYTFTMRHNARFSNGDAVTAQDAAFSLCRFLTPSLGSHGLVYFGLIHGAAAYNAGRAKTISGIKVLGPRTIQITITHPAVYFPMALANYSAVFDSRVVAGKPFGSRADQFQTGYLSSMCTANQGAGPFEFVCQNNSSSIHSFYAGHVPAYTLEPNPYYYGPKPRVVLEYRTYPNIASAYAADRIDASAHLSSLVTGPLRRSRQYFRFPSSGIQFLTPNVNLAPFDDVHCRRAAAYALDRAHLASQAPDSIWRPAFTVVPPGVPGHYAGSGDPHYSIAQARDELARCRERTVPVALSYPDLTAAGRKEGASIVTMLRAAGFKARLRLVPSWKWNSVVTESLGRSDTQLVLNSWAQDYPDPQDYLSLLLRSGARFNVGGWSDPAYDRLVDRAGRLANTTRRTQLYIQAQHVALDQGAFIPLHYKIAFALIKPWVHGLAGTEAYNWLMPRDFDWSAVTVDRH